MNPLAIFAGPYALLAKWGVIALLAAAFGGYCWVKGNQHGTEKLIAYQGAQAVETLKLREARVKVVTKVEVKYKTRIKTVKVKGDTIIKEVPIYVTKTDDAGCIIPTGFVRHYNSAWSDALAGPPIESDRGPSGVPLSGVAEVNAHNATSCLTYKEQRDGLIELYKGLQALEK